MAPPSPTCLQQCHQSVELIDKKIAGNIAHNELVELAELQQQAEKHFDQVAPPPMKDVRQLHQQLLNRRDSQQ